MSKANDIQHGGEHYKSKAIQPWDYIVSNNLGFLEGNAVKYLSRWRDKNGIEDLKKAIHYIEKLIEIENAKKEDRQKEDSQKENDEAIKTLSEKINQEKGNEPRKKAIKEITDQEAFRLLREAKERQEEINAFKTREERQEEKQKWYEGQ